MRDLQVCSCLWRDGMIYAKSLDCSVHIREAGTDRVIISHVGVGDKTREIVADFDLGYGVFRAPDHGFRRAFWDLCHGYVSGFRMRDIAYYIATRSFRRK